MGRKRKGRGLLGQRGRGLGSGPVEDEPAWGHLEDNLEFREIRLPGSPGNPGSGKSGFQETEDVERPLLRVSTRIGTYQ